MKKFLSTTVATAVCGLLGAAPAWSATYTFTTLTIPGAPAGSFQFASSVNDLNEAIVTAEPPDVTFNFTAVDDIYNLGTKTYTPIPPDPAADSGPYNSTQALGINNSGQIVGFYHPIPAVGSAWAGFSLSGGSFTTVIYPAGSTYSYPFGVNDHGQMVGIFYDGVQTNGYVESSGAFRTADVPVAWGNNTFMEALNDSGTAVGGYTPATATASQVFASSSFVYSLATQTFTQVASPAGYAASILDGINNDGVAVGYALNDLINGTDPTGFIYDGGTWTPFNDPLGVEGTYLFGINDEGDIVGTYLDAQGNEHAFVATPTPEPAALALFATGLVGLGFVRRRG
jgi:hypothetical protein